MNKADDQRAPRQLLRVDVGMIALSMRRRIGLMTMGVKVLAPAAMAMAVKMDLVRPDAIEHVQTKSNQHHADGEFKLRRDVVRHRRTQDETGAADKQQSQRVPDAPEEAVHGDGANATSAAREAADGCHVVGLRRMLHADQEPETQSRKQHRRVPYKLTRVSCRLSQAYQSVMPAPVFAETWMISTDGFTWRA